MMVFRGRMENDRFSFWWFLENRPLAALLVNATPVERELAHQWIWKRVQLPVNLLQDEAQDLRQWAI
jgi:hypothetical protein